MRTYYDKEHLPAFTEIGSGQPELARLFFAYYGAVFLDGALTVREKALAALAVAHAVQCPYCIDAYTSGSLEAGADLEQLTEAVHIAAAVRSASTLFYGVQAYSQARALELGDHAAPPKAQAYFHDAHVREREEAGGPRPELTRAEAAWEEAVFAGGALDGREKHAIAVACAHAIQCPYSIDRAVQGALQHGLGLDALTESVHVACAIRGGASLIHGIQMLEQVRAASM